LAGGVSLNSGQNLRRKVKWDSNKFKHQVEECDVPAL